MEAWKQFAFLYFSPNDRNEKIPKCVITCATCELQSTIIIAVASHEHLSAPAQISTDGNMTLG